MRHFQRCHTWNLPVLCSTLLALSGCPPMPGPGNQTRRAERPEPIAPERGVDSNEQLDTLFIPSLPEWTDRYAETQRGDMRFFDMSELMALFDLTRLQAVELQNHYRDLTRSDEQGDRAQHFNTALARVRAGQFESGLDPVKLAAAEFIVVFDLDDTLYDQYHADESCHDIAFESEEGEMKYIKLVPGWEDVFAKIHELGGLIVLFTANEDRVAHENLAHWMVGHEPILQHGTIDGVLTNSYLVLQHKREGKGKDNPRRGQPVVQPSKDLRILDPTLEKVLMVDNNPTRLFQYGNVRVFKRFNAKDYCDASEPALLLAYDELMPVVSAEIEQSVEAMRRTTNISFATAYRPYTMLGQLALDFLMDANHWTAQEAAAFLRAHPDVIDHRY